MFYFIVNTSGGSGRALSVWSELHALLDEENVEYRAYRTERAGDAKSIAERLTTSDKPAFPINLIVVGGDGTINEILNGIADFSRVRLGLIPSGSGNDFARGLAIPKDTRKAWELIKDASGDISADKAASELADDLKNDVEIDIENKSTDGISVDIGEVIVGGRTHRFGISSGIGLDAIVCKKVSTSKLKKVLNKVGLGQLTYIIITVITLFTMDSADAVVNQHHLKKMIFAAAMNVRAEGGGVQMAPSAEYDDGRLSICAAHGIPKWRAFLLLPLLSAGKHGGKKGFLLFDDPEITITTDTPMTVHADGEYLGEYTEVSFRALSGVLKVLR